MGTLPPSSNNQAYCTVSALEAGHFYLPLESGEKFVFDLGIHRDFEGTPPSVREDYTRAN
ncbi:hypothetical protein GYMLUDRAFT_236103 [Collybiopsis luxurians FD-317 M1]|nr:hypothetical protein GYMLUDRAFT_236103 [Collybiopsis luxurians FD-317 M1]